MFGGTARRHRHARHYSDDAAADLRDHIDRDYAIMVFSRGANMNTYWENYAEAGLDELLRRAEAQKKRIRDALSGGSKPCDKCGLVVSLPNGTAHSQSERADD